MEVALTLTLGGQVVAEQVALAALQAHVRASRRSASLAQPAQESPAEHADLPTYRWALGGRSPHALTLALLMLHRSLASRIVPTVLVSVSLVAPLSGPQAQATAERSPSAASTGADVERATESVVSLRVYDPDGRELATGSGFVLQDGRVVTNRHVVEGGSQIEVRSRSGQLLASVSTLSAVSFSVDLAVLPKLTVAPRGIGLASTLPAVGDRLLVIGDPMGLRGSVSDGIVSAIRTIDGVRHIQMTAPVSPGSSGGPVLNSRGEAVGITTWQLTKGQNLNFALSIPDLQPILVSAPGTIPIPGRQVARAPAPASVAGDARSEAGESGGASGARTGLLAAIPAVPITMLTDTDFRLGLLGCFGDPKQSVVVCAVDFAPVKAGRRAVQVFVAELQSLAGGRAVADMWSDGTTSGRLSTETPLVTWSTGPAVRAYLRFVTRYAPDAQVQLGVRMGGAFLKRNQYFAPVRIIDIDASRDAMKWLFGAS